MTKCIITGAATAILIVGTWIGLLSYFAAIDAAKCREYGAVFAGETLLFAGFCYQGSIKIPVEWFGRE